MTSLFRSLDFRLMFQFRCGKIVWNPAIVSHCPIQIGVLLSKPLNFLSFSAAVPPLSANAT